MTSRIMYIFIFLSSVLPCLSFFEISLGVEHATKNSIINFDTKEKNTPFASQLLEDIILYGKDSARIIYELFVHPESVSAVTASSPWTNRSLVKFIEPKKIQSIWELGFGPGNVTREILKKKNPLSYYEGVEVLENFYHATSQELKNNCNEYSSFHLCGAQDWIPAHYIEQPVYDIVISTIAFTTLPPAILQGIMKNITKYLKPGGSFSFITYAFSRSLGYCKFNQENRQAYADKVALFDAWLVENFTQQPTDFIFCNIPPTYIYHWIKK